jgi:hypothetical protein
MLPRIALTIAASILTTIGIAIAVQAGIDRGTGFIDKFIYIGLAVGASLITQFLPSRKGGVMKWLLLSVATCVTLLAHMSYFATSTKTTGEVRAANSQAVTRATQRVTELTALRNAIISRSVTVITAERSLEPDNRKRTALNSELSEENRKIKLSEQIDSLNNELAVMNNANVTDALTNLVTDVSGVPASLVTIIYSFAFFVLIEMSAAYLWNDLFQKKNNTKIDGQMDFDQVVDTKSESGDKAFFDIKGLSMPVKPNSLNVPEVTQTTAETPIIETVNHGKIAETVIMSQRDQLFLKLMQDVREGNCGIKVREVRPHLRCNNKLAGELAQMVKDVLQSPETMQ